MLEYGIPSHDTFASRLTRWALRKTLLQKEAEVKLQIKRNGGTFVIRATVPSRSGIGTERGDFSLGIPANKDGVKSAWWWVYGMMATFRT
ncbi:hypothetical protein H6F89_11515 [Cyanobacteria bacterium FACHB-63]|nr:hypothetical protein [Cyanobacteria bacterium FACHB-63]